MSISFRCESRSTKVEVKDELSTLEGATALAIEAHAGQVDKAGAPYILHPLRVMLAVDGEYERMAAVLHDVVEDCGISPNDLRERGFPEPVVEAIEALTKRPDEHGPDSYFDFVERAGQNDIARAVKLADIADNMDLSRIESPTDKDRARVDRYRKARKLLEMIGRERGELRAAGPSILPLRNRVTLEEVEAECPGTRPIVACDFYIDGAERSAAGGEGNDAPREPGALRMGRITNIDHHAPLPEMERPLTSTKLAFEHIAAGRDPSVNSAPWVVINHTDCDSVLSSALMMGLLEPDEELVAASIAADHTGEPNRIADPLQGLDEGREGDRTEGQYLESLRNLRLLRSGKPLELCAQRALDLRLERRAAAARLVKDGRFTHIDGVAWAILDEEIDGSFFPALLPDAAVIMLAVRHPNHPDRWVMKLRLGASAQPGLTLHKLRIRDWDPAYGGRWNAGSNKRPPDVGVGGTTIAPADYAALIARRVASSAPRATTPLR
jgi:hypothetical protein